MQEVPDFGGMPNNQACVKDEAGQRRLGAMSGPDVASMVMCDGGEVEVGAGRE